MTEINLNISVITLNANDLSVQLKDKNYQIGYKKPPYSNSRLE